MSSFITALVERAIATHLRAQTLTIASTSIYEGIFNDVALENETDETIKASPRIEVGCQNATQYAWPANNWQCEAMVVVVVNADDYTAAQFRTMAGEVADVLCDTTLPASLSSALSGFYCLHINPGAQTWSVDGRSWSFTQNLELFCCPADLS